MKNNKGGYIGSAILVLGFISTISFTTYAECADECTGLAGSAYVTCVNSCNSSQQAQSQTTNTNSVPSLLTPGGGFNTPEAACQKYNKPDFAGPCPQNQPDCALGTFNKCVACAGDSKQTACLANGGTTKFSCESLFVDKVKARECNRNRCVADKGYAPADLLNGGQADMNNPCNCKYGYEGDGKKIGIPLNTSLPFVGRCVERSSGEAGDDSALNAFPTLVSVATRMLVTVILLVSFIMIVVGGVQWSSGDAKGGKAKITKVIIGIAMLGMMGAILRLINPNFFK